MGERLRPGEEEIQNPNPTQKGFAKEVLGRREGEKAEGAAEEDFFRRGEAKSEAAETIVKNPNVTQEGFAREALSRQKRKEGEGVKVEEGVKKAA